MAHPAGTAELYKTVFQSVFPAFHPWLPDAGRPVCKVQGPGALTTNQLLQRHIQVNRVTPVGFIKRLEDDTVNNELQLRRIT